MTLLVTLLALGAIVALHEFGHLLIARACKMRVDRYSLGFGPVLLSFRLGQTEYAISMLPFGGYVKIAGMNPHDGTAADDPRSYQNRPAWMRFLVLMAGPGTNYLLAFAMFSALYFFGMPRPLPTPTLGRVDPGSPAAIAGLKPGDLFVSVNGAPTASFEDVHNDVVASAGKTIPIKVRREGQELTFDITPRASGGSFIIGARPRFERVREPLGQSVWEAARDTAVYNVVILTAIVDKVRGRGNLEVGGPVAAVATTMEFAELGAAYFVLQVALLSVAVALFNLLPVPALDGGRIAFVLIEMVRRRPVDQRFETAVHALGFLVLIGVMIFLTIGDVRKWVPKMTAFQSAAPELTDAGPK